MNERVEENGKTLVVGDLVLSTIKALQLPADPPNYELLYHHTLGDNPPLSRAVSGALAAGHLDSDVADLAEQFFPRRRVEDKVQSLETGVSDEIAHVISVVDLALSKSAGRNVRLEQVLSSLAASDANEVRAIVETLIETAAEIGVATRQLEAQLLKSREKIEGLQQELEAVSNTTLTDSLTSLRNRKGFYQELSLRVAAATAMQLPLSLLMIDIDHFKGVNDRYGHQVGDQVIRLVAAIVQKSLRAGDFAARYGGEEFVVLTRDASPAAAVRLAELIRSSVRSRQFKRRSTDELLASITVSIGIATWQIGEDPSSLVERADACLYRAKRSGRDRVVN